MNPDEIARLRELLATATPGPWAHAWSAGVRFPRHGEHHIGASNIAVAQDVATQNALAIVAAINALPALLNYTEALVAALREARGVLPYGMIPDSLFTQRLLKEIDALLPEVPQ